MVSQSQYARTVSDIRPTVWVYKADDGTIQEREQTQEERQALQTPPKGEYRLKVKGFAVPFEMSNFDKTGMQDMTRLLLEVQGGPGAGKRTTLLVSYTVSKRSNLGRIYGATVGMPEAGSNWDPVLMLEQEFTAYLQPSKNVDEHGKPKGTDCSWDTVAAIGDASTAAATGTDDWS